MWHRPANNSRPQPILRPWLRSRASRRCCPLSCCSRLRGWGMETKLSLLMQTSLPPPSASVGLWRSEQMAAVMDLVPSDKDKGLQTPIWKHYESLLLEADCKKAPMKIERFEFYERAKKAFAVVATGEMALYGNIILKKGTLDLGPS
ncbi:fucose mutarotase isoform X2 [Mus pahari]|uniref:fucose mutarotase isoform X2 n=1 Tax=Mus pahari TaxID=10093 RepID=UPI000A313D54|nr:fucose mutarotase isoform X2 [Mus pahari]